MQADDVGAGIITHQPDMKLMKKALCSLDVDPGLTRRIQLRNSLPVVESCLKA